MPGRLDHWIVTDCFPTLAERPSGALVQVLPEGTLMMVFGVHASFSLVSMTCYSPNSPPSHRLMHAYMHTHVCIRDPQAQTHKQVHSTCTSSVSLRHVYMHAEGTHTCLHAGDCHTVPIHPVPLTLPKESRKLIPRSPSPLELWFWVT